MSIVINIEALLSSIHENEICIVPNSIGTQTDSFEMSTGIPHNIAFKIIGTNPNITYDRIDFTVPPSEIIFAISMIFFGTLVMIYSEGIF